MTESMSVHEHIKYLTKGAFGCIFISDDEPTNNPKKKTFINKIQKRREISNNEVNIGKKVMLIPHYEDYYAPVLKSEKVNIETIDEEEVEKCDFLHKDVAENKTMYESNKILYVGEYSLADYFMNLMTTNETQFIEIFIADHIILLEAIQNLSSRGIIHYDLRENNIMMSNLDSRPIIIDFGLSIDTTASFKPSDAFYRYYNDYAPWCIDVVILSYMVNELGDDWQTKTISELEITKLIDDYLKTNDGVLKILMPDEKTIMRTNMMEYFQTFEHKPWKSLYDDLLTYQKSWDNYGVVIVYLLLFDNLQLSKYVNQYPFLNEYKIYAYKYK